MRYFIRPTLSEESLEPWVWINDNSINGFIRIQNLANGKSIKTYKRTIDRNFIKVYNEKRTIDHIQFSDSERLLIINEYYRKKLNLKTNEDADLRIENEKWFNKIFRIHWGHPHPTVQYTNKVTIISFGIGLLGIVLAIWSMTTICP